MPAPLQTPAPAERGTPPMAPAPPPSQQRPPMFAPSTFCWFKTSPEAPKTNNGPPSMSSVFQRGISCQANSVKDVGMTDSALGPSVPQQKPFKNGIASPANNRPSTTAGSLFRQVKTFGQSEQVEEVPCAGERSSHEQMFNFGTKVVTVRVGREPDHKDFTVHEDLLKRSSYLVDICRQTSNYISLPDARAETFNVYAQWLYSRAIHTKTLHQFHSIEWLKLTNAYLLGHKLGDTDFQDRVMDSMLHWLRDPANNFQSLSVLLDNVAQIYTTLKDAGKDNPLRRLTSDIVALKFPNFLIQKMALERNPEQMPPAFLMDLVLTISQRCVSIPGNPKIPELREACHYHCHAEGNCYRKK